MSAWQAYIDKTLIGAGVANKAAIVAFDGSLLASSQGFSVAKSDVKEILKAFDDPSIPLAHGLQLAGNRYMTLLADISHVFGKKGAEGIIVAKTRQTIIVCLLDLEKLDIRNSGEAVLKLMKYMIDNNC